VIKPTPVGDLKWAEASYNSIRGPIKCRWDRDGDNFKLKFEIPANSTATVYLPASEESKDTEGGKPLGEVRGVKFVRREGDRNVYSVGSGAYELASNI
jgi:alpha-L-rhamnosidase